MGRIARVDARCCGRRVERSTPTWRTRPSRSWRSIGCRCPRSSSGTETIDANFAFGASTPRRSDRGRTAPGRRRRPLRPHQSSGRVGDARSGDRRSRRAVGRRCVDSAPEEPTASVARSITAQRFVPPIEAGDLADRASAKRAMVSHRPSDDDEAGEAPLVGNVQQRRGTPVRSRRAIRSRRRPDRARGQRAGSSPSPGRSRRPT